MPNFGSHLSGPIRHTTRYRSQSERAWFRDLPVGMNDPDFVHHFVDYVVPTDYNTTDWTLSSSGSPVGVVAVNTSSSAVATGASGPLQPVLGGANYGNTYVGALLLQSGTGSSTAGNYSTIQNKAVHWLLDNTIVSGSLGGLGHPIQSSKSLWWECAFSVDLTVLDVDTFVGLSDTQVNPVILGQNYLGFRIVAGGQTINMVSSTGGVATSSTAFGSQILSGGSGLPVVLQNNVMTKVGFTFTNSNSVQFYINRNFMGQLGPGQFPTAPLATTFQVRNSAAVSRGLLVDYFYGCRVR